MRGWRQLGQAAPSHLGLRCSEGHAAIRAHSAARAGVAEVVDGGAAEAQTVIHVRPHLSGRQTFDLRQASRSARAVGSLRVADSTARQSGD